MNSGDIGPNFLLNHNNHNPAHQHPDDLLIPEVSSLAIRDSPTTQENGWAVAQPPTNAFPAVPSSKNHVLLNDSFDFVLPEAKPTTISSAAIAQQSTAAAVHCVNSSNTGGLVEGTLIDLVGEESNACVERSPENLTNGVNHGASRDIGHHLLDSQLESVQLIATSQLNFSSEANAGHSDDEDILCMYSAGSDTQHLLADEQNSHHQHHNHQNAMDRESEPLIAYNRGRLGSTDVTLTISVPGKTAIREKFLLFCIYCSRGYCDCEVVKANCQSVLANVLLSLASVQQTALKSVPRIIKDV